MSSFYYLVQKTGTGKYKCLMGSRSVQACFDRRKDLLENDINLTLSNLIVWSLAHYETALQKYDVIEIPRDDCMGGFGDGAYGY